MSVQYYEQPRRVRWEWFGESFRLFGAAPIPWILGVLIWIALLWSVLGAAGYVTLYIDLIQSLMRGAAPQITPVAPWKPFGASIVNAVLNSFFLSSAFRMANKQVRGETISIGDFFAGGPTILPIFGYYFLFGIASALGVVLCFLPLFIVQGLLWPGFTLVSDCVSVDVALSRSFNAMKVDWLNAALFTLVFTLLVFLSALPCYIGLFVTMPMGFLVCALAYRDMIGMPNVPTDQGGFSYAPPTPGVWPPPPNIGQTREDQEPPAGPSSI